MINISDETMWLIEKIKWKSDSNWQCEGKKNTVVNSNPETECNLIVLLNSRETINTHIDLYVITIKILIRLTFTSETKTWTVVLNPGLIRIAFLATSKGFSPFPTWSRKFRCWPWLSISPIFYEHLFSWENTI